MLLLNKCNLMKKFKYGIIPVFMLLLASCSNDSPAMVKVSLAPLPYFLEAPAEIAKHISIENMFTNTTNPLTKQAQEDGALAKVYIYYKTSNGELHWIAGLYYFKKADYEKIQNQYQSPVYGSVVVESNSMVVLTTTSQENIFDPYSENSKNTAALYTLVYDPKSFISS